MNHAGAHLLWWHFIRTPRSASCTALACAAGFLQATLAHPAPPCSRSQDRAACARGWPGVQCEDALVGGGVWRAKDGHGP